MATIHNVQIHCKSIDNAQLTENDEIRVDLKTVDKFLFLEQVNENFTMSELISLFETEKILEEIGFQKINEILMNWRDNEVAGCH